MHTVLSIRNLSKSFLSAGRPLEVLRDISFDLSEGDTCAIVGPSGSGKTTLLGLAAGLDRPSAGEVVLCGETMSTLGEDERAAVRNRHVGFVFQSFRLIPTLTALENVTVPAELRGDRDAAHRAASLLAAVGLDGRMHHYPAQLSGGEQQRVALARAFINRPRILFADEPTGNLDADTGGHIVDLLFDLNRSAGTTLVLVTHDLELAGLTGRVIRLRGGAVVEDRVVGAPFDAVAGGNVVAGDNTVAEG